MCCISVSCFVSWISRLAILEYEYPISGRKGRRFFLRDPSVLAIYFGSSSGPICQSVSEINGDESVAHHRYSRAEKKQRPDSDPDISYSGLS